MKKRAEHPALPWTIEFDSERHTYTDQEGRGYVSGTSLVRRYFPPFDARGVAARVAARTGEDAVELVERWRREGKEAAEFGTRVHGYAESRVLGLVVAPAATEREAAGRRAVDAALLGIEREYEILGAEQIVFDPAVRVAGMIDLPCRNRATGGVALLDWKFNKKIDGEGWGRFGLGPLAHVPDSKEAHYGMQLGLYAWLMVGSGYLGDGEPEPELAVVHIVPGTDTPNWIPLPYAREEVEAMVKDWWDRSGLGEVVAGKVGAGNAAAAQDGL